MDRGGHERAEAVQEPVQQRAAAEGAPAPELADVPARGDGAWRIVRRLRYFVVYCKALLGST